jgi:hypothetical protein
MGKKERRAYLAAIRKRNAKAGRVCKGTRRGFMEADTVAHFGNISAQVGPNAAPCGIRAPPAASSKFVASKPLRRGRATADMLPARVPIQKIRRRFEHESVPTTEIYLKDRPPDLVSPTPRPMVRHITGPAVKWLPDQGSNLGPAD